MRRKSETILAIWPHRNQCQLLIKFSLIWNTSKGLRNFLNAFFGILYIEKFLHAVTFIFSLLSLLPYKHLETALKLKPLGLRNVMG